MARGAPSPADLQVIRELAAREVAVTASQLESWRRAGLLPRHRRRGLGRGQGSVVDAVDPVVVESAAALARHLRQGRDRRLAVLEWFAEAGMGVRPGAVQVPEPPIGAVRQALVWVLERSVSHRLVEFARGAAGTGEEGQDALYATAGRLVAPRRGAANPALVRAALEAGEDVPVEAEGPDSRSMMHLVAAIGLGAQEVGADALAQAFAASGMYGLTVEDWAQMLGAAERGEGPPVDWGLLERHADVVGPAKRASDEELVRARTVLTGLRCFYSLYVLHGLLLPDTPALAALRQRIDEWGMFAVLDYFIVISPSPRQFAESLAVCLEPLFDNLYEALMEQLAKNPDIFSIPGDETGPVGFGETWMRAVRQLPGPGRVVDGGAGDGPGGLPA
ncbi:hypothetical protein OH738_40170 [Streptomyces hirsutus]|uniref:MerR family transcriptional regulator n=1 Tax=Streptomyces hirsutus TaxID=35620 RepID=A0ABZ1H0R8_9ACTN|nr:hypothetical protein [Streptomyces hirsutus]WSD11223.1 hypothetical protein OIE73_39950 [Streptomyces hirsutus]WTD15423.1 hypothetical protein OH738_00010 [Streptomyces hirsutus]WTD22332.1 hypothetical protein OH738_40170 [Streptomyces hirsutus]